MKNHYMIDIETTGVDRKKDSLLEVGVVEILFNKEIGYWQPTGKEFHKVLHYPGSPETIFAKENMADLYLKCNQASEGENYENLSIELKNWLHGYAETFTEPKFFMGWNASTFDIPFLLEKNILKASYYKKVSADKEVLRGDVHYRVFEQTGALQQVIAETGLSRNCVKILGEELNPYPVKLPEGKSHDALYDCYYQINMANGLIALSRKNINKYTK